MRERGRDRNVTERLDAAAVDVLGRPLGYSPEALKRILSPRYFVEVRRTPGGPAPEETMRAARESRQFLQNDEQWWTSTTEMLAQAERRLGARSAAL